MFGFDDFVKFMQAFFIVFPAVTLLHLLGHVFFVALFGGKGIRVVIGSGKKLFSFTFLEVRRFYFWYGGCKFSPFKFNNKFAKSFIFLGGSIFNLLSILLINCLIGMGVLESSMLWYQFIYFSFYYVFFALFPMDFPDGYPSDGMAVYKLWKRKLEDECSSDCQRIRKKDT